VRAGAFRKELDDLPFARRQLAVDRAPAAIRERAEALEDPHAERAGQRGLAVGDLVSTLGRASMPWSLAM
jgi:hypothetical protein